DDRKRDEERIRNENVILREEVDRASMFEEIVGTSGVLKAVLRQVAQVAPTESTVLITGETGTGKELIARAIHRRSTRAARAFVPVNCAAIPSPLMASELFGTSEGRLPAHCSVAKASSSSLMVERSSSTRWANYQPTPKWRCCACCRSASSSAWVA